MYDQKETNGRINFLAPIVANIPVELQRHFQWVNWKLGHTKKGKPTKIPIRAGSGDKASTTEPRTWSSFAEALKYFETYAAQERKGECQGVGYVLQGDELGIDLDKCRDPETEIIQPWAWEVIRTINSYTEVSPSGTGIRIVCYAEAVKQARHRTGHFEIYNRFSPRYMTITGVVVPGCPSTIERRSAEVAALYARIFPATQEQPKNDPTAGAASYCTAEDAAIIEKASAAKNGEHFKRLWAGEYEDHSAADLALCDLLAFWCGADPQRIDELFRQSGLMREKWEREDYRRGTIQKAIEGCHEFYEWPISEDDLQAAFGERVEVPLDAARPGEGTQPTTTNKRRGYRIRDLMDLPPVSYQVDQHITMGGFNCAFGPFGTGKTFGELDKALCVATGKPYLGIFSVIQGPVAYVAGEGYGGLRKRIWTWMEYYGVKERELDNFCLIPAQFNLLDKKEALLMLQTAVDTLGVMPEALWIDTLNKMFAGGSVSLDKDMGSYCNNLLGLHQFAPRLSINSVHHSGKDQTRGPLGSIVLPAACDTIVEVSGNVESTVKLSCFKQKDGSEFERYFLRKEWMPVPYELDPTGKGSLVLIKDDAPNVVEVEPLTCDTHKQIICLLYQQFGMSQFAWKDGADLLVETDKFTRRQYTHSLKQLGETGYLAGPLYTINPMAETAVLGMLSNSRYI